MPGVGNSFQGKNQGVVAIAQVDEDGDKTAARHEHRVCFPIFASPCHSVSYTLFFTPISFSSFSFPSFPFSSFYPF